MNPLLLPEPFTIVKPLNSNVSSCTFQKFNSTSFQIPLCVSLVNRCSVVLKFHSFMFESVKERLLRQIESGFVRKDQNSRLFVTTFCFEFLKLFSIKSETGHDWGCCVCLCFDLLSWSAGGLLEDSSLWNKRLIWLEIGGLFAAQFRSWGLHCFRTRVVLFLFIFKSLPWNDFWIMYILQLFRPVFFSAVFYSFSLVSWCSSILHSFGKESNWWEKAAYMHW